MWSSSAVPQCVSLSAVVQDYSTARGYPCYSVPHLTLMCWMPSHGHPINNTTWLMCSDYPNIFPGPTLLICSSPNQVCRMYIHSQYIYTITQVNTYSSLQYTKPVQCTVCIVKIEVHYIATHDVLYTVYKLIL